MTTTFVSPERVSSFRQMAASMWGRPADPSIHGFMDVDMTHALRFLDAERARTGRKITVTHLVAQALGHALAVNQDLNAKIHLGGRVLLRNRVDLFVSVSSDGGKDLSGTRLDGADAMQLEEIADAVEGRARDIRADRDAAYARSRGLMKQLPWWMVRPLLWMTDVLTNELHVHLPGLGMPRDPFGSAVLTNVGGFGIDTAFAPMVPLSRCPILLLVTEVKDRPWVVNGRVEVRPVLRLCGTFDHRIVDGHGAGGLANALRDHLEKPRTADDVAGFESNGTRTFAQAA